MQILNEKLEITSDNLYSIIRGYILMGRGFGRTEDVTRCGNGNCINVWADREQKYLIGWIGIEPHTSTKARVEVDANKAQGESMIEFMRKLADYIVLSVDGEPARQKPEEPIPPKLGAPLYDYYDYYHAEHDRKKKCTFPMLSKMSAISVGTFKNNHAKYKFDRKNEKS
jgi:hypothetical protein